MNTLWNMQHRERRLLITRDPASALLFQSANPAKIRSLQRSLNILLGINLPLDGILGVTTRSALRQFQRSRGLPASGLHDEQTMQTLIRETRLCRNRTALTNSEDGEAQAALAAVGAGLAAVSFGKDILTSGDFSAKSSVISIIHSNTPSYQKFKRAEIDFVLSAHHPLPAVGKQSFWFKLIYEYNGNDIRDARIHALVSRSSSLYASTFTIDFSGSGNPKDAVAEARFTIDGRWNPAGPGNVSFSGQLHVRADGSMPNISINSEEGWVTFKRFSPVIPPAEMVPPNKVGLTSLRPGSRGDSVKYLQQQLNKWAEATEQHIKLRVDGIYGAATTDAVRAFQRQARIKIDGIAGPETRHAMAYIRV